MITPEGDMHAGRLDLGVLSIRDLTTELHVSDHVARQIAHELGIRIGKRLLVPRVRLEAWLRGEDS